MASEDGSKESDTGVNRRSFFQTTLGVAGIGLLAKVGLALTHRTSSIVEFNVNGAPLTSAVVNTMRCRAGNVHTIRTSPAIYEFISSQGYSRRQYVSAKPSSDVMSSAYSDGDIIWWLTESQNVLYVEGNKVLSAVNFSLNAADLPHRPNVL